ncbi:glycosyltransferase, partial [bacterium]|nr:glycosyltransferase [bacterium]
DDYRIVLVGTDDCVDKQLPANIISIHRTQNQKELAEIYTAADVFANPTREDTFPTVNMESLACGTPVVTFRTGGSPEILDETCGFVVDCNDIDGMEMEIRRICEKKTYSKDACLERAKSFDMNDRFKDYVDLYEGRKN